MRALPLLLLATLFAAAPAPAQTLDEAVRLYLAEQGPTAASIFESLVRADPADPEPRAWLAEYHARESRTEPALRLARGVLAEHPCHPIAHHALATAFRDLPDPPARDSAWAHASRAVQCAPGDGNGWVLYASTALMQGDTAAERRAELRLGELGFYTPPVMELARWTLRSAPRGAVLVAGGEWDYVPMRVAQVAEGVRPDVTVLTLMMMEWPHYVRRSAARSGYPVPPRLQGVGDYEFVTTDTGGVLTGLTGALWAEEWIEGRNPRPLVLSLDIVDPSFVRSGNRLRWDGPVISIHRLSPGASELDREMDPAAFNAAMADLDLARLAGPRVHATDRSPFRHWRLNPGMQVGDLLLMYASVRAYAGDRAGAAQGLRWAEALLAAGAVGPEFAESIGNTREYVQGRLKGRP